LKDMKILYNFFEKFGEYIVMVAEVIWLTFRSPPSFRLIREQLYETGVQSLPVVAVTGLSTGMVLAAQAFFQLSDKGLTSTTGLMVAKSMIVELGPILTAFMITGRVGAAIAAELGTMRVTEQIDALSSMAVSPIRYLIVPRFIAMVVMVPVLTVFSSAMGILGGYFIAVNLYGMAPHTYFEPLPYYITWFDLFSGLSKSFVFGILIVTISSFRGMLTRGGAQGVGRATTNSVVICYSAILIANFLLTVALNASYWFIYNP
jgi:phospholipid/cholesterol/gamma-HCH transport system permease protein